jgi:DNA-binding IclR family transcriptional regulator
VESCEIMAGAARRPTDRVREFLRTNLKASWEIELLILMRNENEREWDISSLQQRLMVEPDAVERCLSRLKTNGLVTWNQRKRTYAFAPENAENNALVDLLATNYERNRLTVIRMLYDGR